MKPSERGEGPCESSQSEIRKSVAVKFEELQDTLITVSKSEPGTPRTASSGPMKIQHKICSPPKAEIARDLIEFSDTDILDTGNLGDNILFLM